MNMREFLAGLEARDVKIWKEGDKLRVRAPEGALTEVDREHLRVHRDALLRFFDAPNEGPQTVIAARDANEPVTYPLSSSQRRLWLLEQLAPGPRYHIHLRIAWNGDLDIALAQRALDELGSRYEILRTVYIVDDGEVRQCVEAVPRLAVRLVDVRELASEDASTRIDAELRHDRRTPFDLARDPLLRWTVFRSTNGADEIAFTMHHILGDASSIVLLLHEFRQVYEALAAGLPLQLGTPALQYGVFARWEREQATSVARAQGRTFWREELAGIPPLVFPEDAVFESEDEHAEVIWDRYDGSLVGALKRYALEAGVSLYALFLTAVGLAVETYARQRDFSIATVVSGRDRPELQGMLGCFVNTVLFRWRSTEAQTVETTVRNTADKLVSILNHQSVPFDEVLADAAKSTDAPRESLARVCFVFEPPASGAPLLVRRDTVDAGVAEVAKFDLMVVMQEAHDGSVDVSVQYRNGWFARDTAERWRGYVRRALDTIVDASETRLAQLDLLAADERRALLAPIAPVEVEPGCIHTSISRQVERTPDAIALEGSGRQFTYRDLQLVAGALAARLRSLGVGPETRVAIMLDRGPLAVIALLGILNAGGAYVPIDADLPESRRNFMLEDAGVHCVITSRRWAPHLEAHGDALVFIEEFATPSVSATPLPAAPCAPNNLAYVLYTSGSTGHPKGVMVEHRHVMNLFVGLDAVLGRERGRWLAVTSLSFDISVVEVLYTLSRGYTVVVTGDRNLSGAESDLEVPALLEQYRITHFQCTPSRAQIVMSQEGGESALHSLRVLILAGEVFPPALARRLLVPGGPRLINGYGPTEVTVYTALHRVERVGRTVPIGFGVCNNRLYVLDEHGRPVPRGSIGELYVAGPSVARGYLQREELTRERFLADPFDSSGRFAMYKTGDLVRFGAEGALEYIGRVDFQVKVRGYRIELGEIEARLDEHPAVGQSAVTVIEDESGGASIVGFVTTHEENAPDLERRLREHVAVHVPPYMVPNRILLLESFPLTTSGKVDRKRLPRPMRAEVGATAPMSETERQIVEIWSRVLDLGPDRIGLDDGFFDLGGHSLLAARVRAELEEGLGLHVPLVELFKHPTVRALARALEQRVTPVEQEVPLVVSARDTRIAIVGIACRVPGADDLEGFWRNLCEGLDGITTFSREQLVAAGWDEARIDDPLYVPRKGIIEAPEDFDAEFFGIGSRDAAMADPQHRLLLELAWHAMEDAGLDPSRSGRRTGVYAAVGHGSYLMEAARHGALPESDMYRAMLLNDKDFVATRIAHHLDLHGPCATIQTACSSGLVATHMACRALNAGEADVMLVGACSVTFPTISGYEHQPHGIQSSDGRCRPFDAQADGTVFGHGAVVVVLQRLEDALQTGAPVYGVIRGSAINNDGREKVAFTAPSIEGQAEVIRAAHRAAAIDPAQIGYIETHGTGTAVGDPIEVEALRLAFAGTRGDRPCVLGSVKSNIGHVDTAAGLVGLTKSVLAVQRGVLPGTLHYTHPNPELPTDTRFRVCASTSTWDAPIRIAGVSSFGIGGTNAHVVLEQPPPVASSTDGEDGGAAEYHVLPLSARSPEALRIQAERLADHLSLSPDALRNVAYTLQEARAALPYRAFVVAHDRATAIAALRRPLSIEQVATPPQIVFRVGSGSGDSSDRLGAFLSRHMRACDEAIALAADPGHAGATGSAAGPSWSEARRRWALAWAWHRGFAELGIASIRITSTTGNGTIARFLRDEISVAEAAAEIRNMACDPVETDHLEPRPGTLVLDLPSEAAFGTTTQRGFATAVAEAWRRGVPVVWSPLYADSDARRVRLPTYPFQRRRHSLLPERRAIAPTRSAERRFDPPAPMSAELVHLRRTVAFVAPRTPVEIQLVAMWERQFGFSGIGIQDDFYELGGDSFAAVELVGAMKRIIDERLTLDTLVDHSTIAGISEALGLLAAAAVDAPRPQAAAAPRLPLDIRVPNAARVVEPPRRVLLTGATGYLGAFLLEALVREAPETTIHCLVRGKNLVACEERLFSHLARLRVVVPKANVVVLPGDLSHDCVGMSDVDYARMTEELDTIVHAGAIVNFTLPREQLHPPNVLGTERIIRLACTGRIKPLHFVSTLAVFESREGVAGPFDERSGLDHGLTLVHGYAESKWAAEHLVLDAKRRGLPTSIYRPGPVSGHRETGVCNTDDFASRMLRGMALLGAAPQTGLPIVATPVDHVATSIARHVARASLLDDPLHLVSPKPTSWGEVLSVLRDRGYRISAVEHEHWRRLLRDHVHQDRTHPLYPILPLLERSEREGSPRSPVFQCDSSVVRLKRIGLDAPEMSREAIRRQIEYLVSTNKMIPPPRMQGEHGVAHA